MPAGTIALTNNSATVTGTGSSFTTELKVNDFLVSTVGGVAYTLGVKSIESNTSLTLIEKYTGPSASGQSWTPVPYGTMAAITAQLAAQVTYAVRGLNLDKANWQKIFSSDQSITVSLPDLNTFTGPSWGYLASQLGNSLIKTQNLSDLADKSAARSNLGLGELATIDGPLPINKGGTGRASPFGTAANTFAQGNDSRLDTVNSKTGGTISSAITVNGAVSAVGITSNSSQPITVNGSGYRCNGQAPSTTNTSSLGWGSGVSDLVNNRGSGLGGWTIRIVNADNSANIAVYNLQANGVGLAPGGWQTGSDERIKEDIEEIDPQFALSAVLKLRHVTFKMRDRPDGEGGWIKGDRSAGYLAQDLEKYLPEAVSTASNQAKFDDKGNQVGYPYMCKADDGSILEIEDMKSVDPGKAAAALNGAAIKALHDMIQKQDEIIAELQKRLKAIDGLDA